MAIKLHIVAKSNLSGKELGRLSVRQVTREFAEETKRFIEEGQFMTVIERVFIDSYSDKIYNVSVEITEDSES